ncbi:hypothetical protein Droror1_Dr00014350 [Drosera rotundifolia]
MFFPKSASPPQPLRLVRRLRSSSGTATPTPSQSCSHPSPLPSSVSSSGIVVAVVLFVVFGLLSSLFEGKVVGKLPFVPVSHRGLSGEDLTDCSMAFLYLVCSVSIRTNLQKFLGFAPPRGAIGGGLFPSSPDQKFFC